MQKNVFFASECFSQEQHYYLLSIATGSATGLHSHIQEKMRKKQKIYSSWWLRKDSP